MSDVIEVGIGTEFRSVIADGNALWCVIGKAGPDVWTAEVQPEWAEVRGERMRVDDYAGSTDVFTTERIAGSINMDNVFARLADDSDAWWEDRAEGSIVHYHNGFGQYVRGRIMTVDGETQMLPIALVGKWDEHDLVSWTAWGEVRMGYHAQEIEDGETMRPHASNMYECPNFSGPRGQFAGENPRELDALDLTPPERGPNEVAYHEAIALRNSINGVLDACRPETAEEVYAVLNKVKGMIP